MRSSKHCDEKMLPTLCTRFFHGVEVKFTQRLRYTVATLCCTFKGKKLHARSEKILNHVLFGKKVHPTFS